MREYLVHQFKRLLNALTPMPADRTDARGSREAPPRRDGAPPDPQAVGRGRERRRRFVFVSHFTADKQRIRLLVDALQGTGVRVWFDEKDILPGMRWETGAIHPALDQAACILVCFSKSALKDEHRVFWDEANFARVRGNIVPCIIDDLAPEELPKEFLAFQFLRVGLDQVPTSRELSDLVKGVVEKIKRVSAEEAAARTGERIPYEVNDEDKTVLALPDEIFAGRAKELRELHHRFESGGTCVAIYGMPGVGKSSLAAKYAASCGHNFHGVFWFGAERIPDLVQKIAKIGKAMTPPVEAADPDDDKAIARATIDRLDASGDEILYVLDNVEKPEDILGLLPRSRLARVLITSKYPDWRKHVDKQIDLDVLTLPEAQRFLLTRTKPNDDEAGAAAVAELVGCLPLMLEQAAANYVLGTDFAAFKRSFEESLRSAPAQLESSEDKGIWASVHTCLDTLKKSRTFTKAEFQPMLEYLGFCAADAIPPSLFKGALDSEAHAYEAIAALMSVALIRRDPSGKGSVSLHRTTQGVARGLAQQRGTAATRFGRVVKRLGEIRPEDVTEHNWKEWVALTPHLLSVVELAREEWLEESGEEVDLDHFAKLVVLAILYAREEAGDDKSVLAAPERLVRVLGMFYEVEPLAGALKKLVEKKREDWPRLRDQLLTHNNYVLRHALAQALADAIGRGLMQVERATELLVPGSTLNKVELGGYALNFIYASRPDQIDKAQLAHLAEHPCYPGRTILGDLMLNLAFDDRRWPLHQLLPSQKFWRSKWDFIALDADAVEAAQAFMSTPRLRPEGASEAVLRDFDFFCEMEAACRKLAESETQPEIAALLRDYQILGREPDRIRKAEEEFKRSPHLLRLMEVLFAHPQWSVAEAAATVLARIAGLALKARDRGPARIVTELFDSPHWRVRYGAAEASYALRQDDDLESFTAAVRRFYNDPNCKIRGLCAEDLGATILSTKGDERERMIWDFAEELSYWLQDEDCWVLEHVHRFFSELWDEKLRDVGSREAKRLLGGPISRLIGVERDWPAMDREAFLLHIEARKPERAA